MSSVVTRFAPSPTGFLHVGGARTALFNWLYAKHHHGKFLLRIDDTDKKRSTYEAINAIIDGLKWLGINCDDEIIYQSKRIKRHVEIANFLAQKDMTYYCYCSQDEVIEKKVKARKEGKIYKHKCTNEILGVKPVVRFRVPYSQDIIFYDKIYGQIKVNSEQIDDIVILRSDMTPTYIFAVVVDDHDAGVTDVIRGSDHLTNTFRQLLIYHALNFNTPRFAHVPLIHGEDGSKLSKRYGAASICDYKKTGILPQAMRNYLLRLGWSHGNDEIINDKQAIEWFNLENIGRSPARLDSKKLEHLNKHYINNMSNEDILSLMPETGFLAEKKKNYLLHGLTELKKRVSYLTELLDLAQFYIRDPPLDLSKDAKLIVRSNFNIIKLLVLFLSNISDESWNNSFLYFQIKKFSRLHNVKISDVYNSLRAAITGIMSSPGGIIGIMVILRKEECIKRLQAIIV